MGSNYQFFGWAQTTNLLGGLKPPTFWIGSNHQPFGWAQSTQTGIQTRKRGKWEKGFKPGKGKKGFKPGFEPGFEPGKGEKEKKELNQEKGKREKGLRTRIRTGI